MPEVRVWLEELGLGQYAETFEAEKIEVGDLGDLVEADLEKLGLPMGHRKRLLRAIAALASGSEDQTDAAGSMQSPKWTPAPLAEKILSARATIEGERKQVTVLFADVKGSTDLVQYLDAEEVTGLFDPQVRYEVHPASL
jgi:hypothetical protein